MRTLLTGELATAQDPDSDYYVKLEAQNASGTWKDVGALLGSHWIVNATWTEHRDQTVSQGTFTLVRNLGPNSISPLMSASVLNVDDDDLYAPLLEVGRLIRASTATMPHGVPLDITKYRPVFSGRIDNVSESEDANGNGTIVLPCSDLGAWLMDCQIETSGAEYGDPVTPPALETVIQSILNDNIPSGEPSVTLTKQSSSIFGVTSWKEDTSKVLEALITIVSDSVGEDIRYRFDASHAYNLTWFDPDRDRTSIDASFNSEIYVLKTLERALQDVRNAGSMEYTDSTTFLTGTVTSVDAVSSAPSRFRRRFFRIPASKMVQSEAEAQAVVDKAVHDLANPPADATAETPYFWPVQLYDRHTFEANGRQYDEDQTFAVSGFTHTIENGKGTTSWVLSERVIGAYGRWLKRMKAGGPASKFPLNNLRPIREDATTKTYGWDAPYPDEVWFAYDTFPNPFPNDPWAIVLEEVSPLPAGVHEVTIAKPKDGTVGFLRLEARDAGLTAGTKYDFEIHAAAVRIPFLDPDDSEDSTHGYAYARVIEQGIPVVGDPQVQTQIGEQPVSKWGTPSTMPGDYSVVKKRVLVAGEVEHAETLDAERPMTIRFRWPLANGEYLPSELYEFDRDKNPNIRSVVANGTLLLIDGDTDCKSYKVENGDSSWVRRINSFVGHAQVDVGGPDDAATAGLGSAARDTFKVTAYNQPVVNVDGDSLFDIRYVNVGGATAADPAARLLYGNLAAPPIDGSQNVVLTLLADAAPAGVTVQVHVGAVLIGTNPVIDESTDIAPSLLPTALTTPPLTQTDYAFDSGYPSVPIGSFSKRVTMKMRVDFVLAGAVVFSQTFVTQFYTGEPV